MAGFVTYRDAPGTRALVHTEVPPEFGGRGLAAALIGAALDDLRAQGLGLVPLCPYVRAYLERHPEQADLVAAGGTA